MDNKMKLQPVFADLLYNGSWPFSPSYQKPKYIKNKLFVEEPSFFQSLEIDQDIIMDQSRAKAHFLLGWPGEQNED